jgi:hypothetical protein
MINETLLDKTVENLADLIGAVARAAFEAGFQSRCPGDIAAKNVKLYQPKLRVQLVQRKAADGDAFELIISSGGAKEPKLEPAPRDGPTVTADEYLPEHLRAAEKDIERAAAAQRELETRNELAAERIDAGMWKGAPRHVPKDDAGDVPAFLDRTVKSHGTIDF